MNLIYLVPLSNNNNNKKLKFAAEMSCILLAFSFYRSGNNFPCDPHKQTHSTDQEQQRICDAV